MFAVSLLCSGLQLVEFYSTRNFAYPALEVGSPFGGGGFQMDLPFGGKRNEGKLRLI
jgi:hypothetical protein